MAYKRNGYPAKALTPDTYRTFAAFVGAGAAAPTVATAAQNATVFPGAVNQNADLAITRDGVAGCVVTRTGVGDHTYTFAAANSPAVVHDVKATAWGTSDLDATIRSITLTSGVLAVRVLTKTAAGVATDLAASVDFLKLTIDGAQVTV